jgi:hypothetical protein
MSPTVHLLKIQAECHVKLARIAQQLADPQVGSGTAVALHELQQVVKQLQIATTALLNAGRKPDSWWWSKVQAVNAQLRRYVR